MKILVDADACPAKNVIEQVAKEFSLPLVFLIDTSHILEVEYGEVITVSKGIDAVDFALINRVEKGDIVVTQDYGVAAMVLGKKAYAIHQKGKIYTNENIEQMLFERHLSKVARRASNKYHGKGPKKRTKEDDERFLESLRKLVKKALSEQS